MTTDLLARLLQSLGIRVGRNPSVVSASRTLSLQDDKDVLYCDSATDITLTIRHDLPEGYNVTVIQGGAGKVHFAGQPSETLNDWLGVAQPIGNQVTFNALGAATKTAGAGAKVRLIQYQPNTYVLTGDAIA